MYKGIELYTCSHAYQRMEERIGNGSELLNDKIRKILSNGIESRSKLATYITYKKYILKKQCT
jgi:hypothetical protein